MICAFDSLNVSTSEHTEGFGEQERKTTRVRIVTNYRGQWGDQLRGGTIEVAEEDVDDLLVALHAAKGAIAAKGKP